MRWKSLLADVAYLAEAVERLNQAKALGTLPLAEFYRNIIREELSTMALDMSALAAAVDRERTVTQSVLVLLDGLQQQIKALSDQLTNSDAAATAQIQSQLNSLVSQINDQSDQLAAAVTANTPQPLPATSSGGA